MTPELLTLAAFVRARFLMHRLRNRASLEDFQRRRISRFLQEHVPQAPAFANARFGTLEEAPRSDKSMVMANFERYNCINLGAEEGWGIFHGRLPNRPGVSVGASTGTSGNRGLYVVSEPERYRWLGVMLSRTLPEILVRSERVAVMLPQASRLYDAANESRRLKLKFFHLSGGIEGLLDPVAAFAPTVVVAPPRILRGLAEANIALAPRLVFSGGEVLDPLDQSVIEAGSGRPVRQIYMATEGLFAVSCAFGSLHLTEDHIAFETLPVPGSTIHFNPVITDFSRTTQVMLRYRMNDIVTFASGACRCGSPHRTLSSIVGRLDDSFVLMGVSGKTIVLTPDVIRNAIAGSDRRIDDFKVLQVAEDRVIVRLKPEHAELLAAACGALAALFDMTGAAVSIDGESSLVAEDGAHKLRRVAVAYDRTGP